MGGLASRCIALDTLKKKPTSACTVLYDLFTGTTSTFHAFIIAAATFKINVFALYAADTDSQMKANPRF